jgi:hypothetical protein
VFKHLLGLFRRKGATKVDDVADRSTLSNAKCVVVYIRKQFAYEIFLQDLKNRSPIYVIDLVDGVELVYFSSDRLSAFLTREIPAAQKVIDCAWSEGQLLLTFDRFGKLAGRPVGMAMDDVMREVRRLAKSR